MSYDVNLMIHTGKEWAYIVDCGNYTYNVSPMYYDVMEHGLDTINEMIAEEAISILEKAVEKLKSNPDKYKAMNPSNGWGSYEGALKYLETILENCKEHPKTTVLIS